MTQNPAKRKCPSYGSENVTCLGQTDIEEDTFSFLWTISNYAALSKLGYIDSPIFRGGPKSNHSWKLSMYPKKKVENVGSLGLYLGLVDLGDANDSAERLVKTTYQFSILNANGQPGVQHRQYAYFRKSGSSIGTHQLISSADLVAPDKQLVVNDSLKILCQLWIDGGLTQKLIPKCATSEEERSRVWRDRLVSDIGKMYEQSIGTDVTISTGTSTFKAHKGILTARSSVFAAMFNNANSMLEAETATVTISDFDEEVVKGMLQHLYTGNADCIAERAPELLQIAEKYDLAGLKEHCEFVVADNLQNDNVVEILVMAEKFNASYLKSRAVDFIKINKRELSQMESFLVSVKDSNSASGIFAELFLAQP